ncbi:unannotated protein [freshwater metagenome]|uniref:Unannotated protein n=1 Tax=freshwater metagenome TaxID=449393 RepID=A0A6J6MGV8_9ZZZZ
MRVIRKAWIATNTVEVLYSSLCWQTVVVPTHWVEHFKATHALIASHAVGMGVREDVTYVKRTTHGWWRGINGKDLITGLAAIEGVVTLAIPNPGPAILNAVEGGLFRYTGAGHGGQSY